MKMMRRSNKWNMKIWYLEWKIRKGENEEKRWVKGCCWKGFIKGERTRFILGSKGARVKMYPMFFGGQLVTFECGWSLSSLTFTFGQTMGSSFFPSYVFSSSSSLFQTFSADFPLISSENCAILPPIHSNKYLHLKFHIFFSRALFIQK